MLMKKLTLDLKPDTHQRLRLLAIVLDRSISSLVTEAIDKALEEHHDLIPTLKTISRTDQSPSSPNRPAQDVD